MQQKGQVGIEILLITVVGIVAAGLLVMLYADIHEEIAVSSIVRQEILTQLAIQQLDVQINSVNAFRVSCAPPNVNDNCFTAEVKFSKFLESTQKNKIISTSASNASTKTGQVISITAN